MKKLILSTALLCSMLSACSTDTAQTEQTQEESSSETTEATEPASPEVMSPDSTQADTTAHGHSHGGGEEHEH